VSVLEERNPDKTM